MELGSHRNILREFLIVSGALIHRGHGFEVELALDYQSLEKMHNFMAAKFECGENWIKGPISS
jgi:hypothetical protein